VKRDCSAVGISPVTTEIDAEVATGDDEVPDMVGSDSEDEDVEGEAGCRLTKKMPDPRRPSSDQVEEHNKTHLPFRNWCRHCVLGRGKEMAHYRSNGKPSQNAISTFALLAVKTSRAIHCLSYA
jgi:hypothetical protein